MIDELHVQDVALIHDATIRPCEGLTVLTGETGAGKTALLSALKLLVGERADASWVREGADGLEVSGRVFSGPDDLDGHVVRRTVAASGRGRVELDGSMASVGELASTIGAGVDLCGQHEHQQLLSVATHVALLDAVAGARGAEALKAYDDALAHATGCARELERIQQIRSSGSAALEQARFVLSRIDEVDPQPDELKHLEESLPRAEHAEALLRAASVAHGAISDDGGAVDALSSAMRELDGASGHDPALGEWSETLRGALLDIEDVAASLRDYRDDIELDPRQLEAMQSRMAELQGLMRTYGPRMDDVFARRDEARALVDSADDDGSSLQACERACTAAEAELSRRADELDAVRAEAAPVLTSRVGEQMARLEMGSASLEVSQTRQPRESWGASGPSHVELMYRPGAGLTPRPLRRIASGGEVSRVMLATKVVAGQDDSVDTLVFDEVDAGVGGATAKALALVLADLARTHQVIVVTHLAQVAVVGQRHYVVEKVGTDTPQTVLREVAGDERVAEVARLLSGDASAASLAHAREMLDEARS